MLSGLIRGFIGLPLDVLELGRRPWYITCVRIFWMREGQAQKSREYLCKLWAKKPSSAQKTFATSNAPRGAICYHGSGYLLPERGGIC